MLHGTQSTVWCYDPFDNVAWMDNDVDDVHEHVPVETVVDEGVEQEGFPSVVQASWVVFPEEQATLGDIDPCIMYECLLSLCHIIVICI
jgi:hypothetical protein